MTDENRVVRPFADLLREHRKGLLHAELGDELQRLVERVKATGKAGKLTLVLQVKPAAKGDDMVVVADEVKTALPQPDRGTSFFYIDDDFNLVRHDPHQPELPLRVAGDKEAKA